MRLIDRGDNDYDVIDGELELELSYHPTSGSWRLWNIRYAGARTSCSQAILDPGPLSQWLDEQRRVLADAETAI